MSVCARLSGRVLGENVLVNRFVVLEKDGGLIPRSDLIAREHFLEIAIFG